MGDDINIKRDFVASLYPMKRWRNRVNKMSDAQVIAIYFKEKDKDHSKKPKKEREDDIPF